MRVVLEMTDLDGGGVRRVAHGYRQPNDGANAAEESMAYGLLQISLLLMELMADDELAIPIISDIRLAHEELLRRREQKAVGPGKIVLDAPTRRDN